MLAQTIPPSGWWTATSTLAAAASAFFAAAQIYLGRRDARRQSAFDHFREIEEKVQNLFGVDTTALQTEVLSFYSREADNVSAEATRYLALLNALELLSFARLNGAIDARLTDRYLQTLIKSHLVNVPTLRALQDCCKDPALFEHLVRYAIQLNATRTEVVRDQR